MSLTVRFVFGTARTASTARAAGTALVCLVGLTGLFGRFGISLVGSGSLFAAGTTTAAGRAGFAAIFRFGVSFGLAVFGCGASGVFFVATARTTITARGSRRTASSGFIVFGVFILGWIGCECDSCQSEYQQNYEQFDLSHDSSPLLDRNVVMNTAGISRPQIQTDTLRPKSGKHSIANEWFGLLTGVDEEREGCDH